jgi:DoxX-like family
MDANRLKFFGYWASTVLVAGLFVVPGAALLVQVPHFVEDMRHLGYPLYFLGILGVSKIAGAAAILSPGLRRLKEWAYAGLVFDALMASASRFALQDPPLQVIFPLAIAGLCLISWALRPGERRLATIPQ